MAQVTADWIPNGRAAFVPRSHGFGARLLGIDAATAGGGAQALIRIARHERDLLRPDLTLVSADPTLLPAALGRRPREQWATVELGQASVAAALAAVVEAANALAREGPVGVLLAGPVALAGAVAGESVPASLDEDWQDLVDACGIVLCGALGPVLDAGAHAVLEEPSAPDEAVLELTSPLWNLLRHRRRPCLAIVLSGGPGALVGCDAVAAVAHGPAVGVLDGHTGLGASGDVLSPPIEADASPEQVQSIVRELQVA